jgi:hypothetical protein
VFETHNPPLYALIVSSWFGTNPRDKFCFLKAKRNKLRGERERARAEPDPLATFLLHGSVSKLDNTKKIQQ